MKLACILRAFHYDWNHIKCTQIKLVIQKSLIRGMLTSGHDNVVGNGT